jgi:intergrase/recombinase
MIHELTHIIGLCPDTLAHIDLIDFAVANYQTFADIKIKTIKNYVAERIRSRKTTTNKRKRI